MDWIGFGGMTVTPFLISNHCSTVDMLFLSKYDLDMNFDIPVLPRLKFSIRISSWNIVHEFDLIPIYQIFMEWIGSELSWTGLHGLNKNGPTSNSVPNGKCEERFGTVLKRSVAVL